MDALIPDDPPTRTPTAWQALAVVAILFLSAVLAAWCVASQMVKP